MQEFIYVTGMVLKQSAIGEYDRRLCILTKERGKISAFAKGARKPGSRLAAAACPFAFGTFKLYEGKNSYTVAEADIRNYFEALRSDFEGAYYGMYFAEIADYYTRENNDEKEMLKLMYQSLRALSAASLDRRLVRAIVEIKAVGINGEFPGIPQDREYMPSTLYAVDFILSSRIEKLYTFTVKEEVLQELIHLGSYYRRKLMDKEFKSLEILQTLC